MICKQIYFPHGNLIGTTTQIFRVDLIVSKQPKDPLDVV